MSADVLSAEKQDVDEPCQTCRGHGFRVEIASGRTLNVEAAKMSGMMNGARRILCRQCQPVGCDAIAAPEPQAKSKPPQKHSIDVAGTKPAAYVALAEAE